MIEKANEFLQDNDIMVRIGSIWYCLDEIGPIGHNEFPIIVSDDDGGEHQFDMADIDEFDPSFELMDLNHMGVA
tara:strand:+ start:3281 stop:3502 length:222 start_codon:yes stop_codon:yes gene_type:complete